MQFGILGPLRVTDDSHAVAFSARNLRVLLAVLLCQPNRPVSTDGLIDAVWGQTPPKTAAKNLQGYVHQLRRSLGQSRVARHPHGYAVEIHPGELDADVFEDRVSRGKAMIAAGELRQGQHLLAEALAVWRGPAFADLAGVAALGETTTRLTQQRLGAFEDRVDVDLALGTHASVVAELSAQIMAHPLRERMRGQLMIALYRCGRQVDALQVYNEGRTILAEELGLEPGEALRRIQLAILRGSDVGVEQASTTSPIQPAQLPIATSAFTGRAAELAQLDRLCSLADREGTPGVVSAIAGMAGVGKTALALHWAHQARPRFPDGQLYVNLRGFSSTAPLRPIEALSRFLHALGVAPAQVPLDTEEAAALYRSMLTDKRMMIILDNARDAAQVRSLLPGSPHCLVLVTSRNGLNGLTARDGAHGLRLGVLTADEAAGLLERLLGVDRADREPDAVAELAKMCAYLPLALRIAAANITSRPELTVSGYVHQLGTDDLVEALAVYGDDEAAVRSAFDLSLEALPTDQRRLFCLLSLVPGADFTAEAAAALADVTDRNAVALLDGLVNAHLVDRHPHGRYTLHDLLRRYAAEQVVRGHKAEPAVRRLFACYLGRVESAARVLYPELTRPPGAGNSTSATPFPSDTLAAGWLDTERANLVAAVTYASDHRLWPEAWLLADALRGYFHQRAHFADWLTVARAGLSAAHEAGERSAEAGLHLSLCVLYWRQTDHRTSWRHITTALELARESGWQEGEAAILNNMGIGVADLGQLESAMTHLTRAHEINKQIGSRSGRAINLVNLAQVSLMAGDREPAVGYALESLDLYTELNSPSGQAEALMSLGEAQHLLGLFDESIVHLTRAVEIRQDLGDLGNRVPPMCLLSAAYVDSGSPDQAQDLADLAVTLARAAGEPRHEVIAGYSCARVRHSLGDIPAAVESYQQALGTAQGMGERYIATKILIGLATARHALGEHQVALVDAEEALTIAGTHGYQLLSAQALALVTDLREGKASADGDRVETG